MIRIWAIFFTIAFSVMFRRFDPKKVVHLPLGNDYQFIPQDVFFYHLFEHMGQIIIGVVIISLVLYPSDRSYLFAYLCYAALLIVDAVLYSVYYRGWFSQTVPWNVVKTSIFGLVVIRYQFIAFTKWKNSLKQ